MATYDINKPKDTQIATATFIGEKLAENCNHQDGYHNAGNNKYANTKLPDEYKVDGEKYKGIPSRLLSLFNARLIDDNSLGTDVDHEKDDYIEFWRINNNGYPIDSTNPVGRNPGENDFKDSNRIPWKGVVWGPLTKLINVQAGVYLDVVNEKPSAVYLNCGGCDDINSVTVVIDIKFFNYTNHSLGLTSNTVDIQYKVKLSGNNLLYTKAPESRTLFEVKPSDMSYTDGYTVYTNGIIEAVKVGASNTILSEVTKAYAKVVSIKLFGGGTTIPAGGTEYIFNGTIIDPIISKKTVNIVYAPSGTGYDHNSRTIILSSNYNSRFYVHTPKIFTTPLFVTRAQINKTPQEKSQSDWTNSAPYYVGNRATKLYPLPADKITISGSNNIDYTSSSITFVKENRNFDINNVKCLGFEPFTLENDSYRYNISFNNDSKYAIRPQDYADYKNDIKVSLFVTADYSYTRKNTEISLILSQQINRKDLKVVVTGTKRKNGSLQSANSVPFTATYLINNGVLSITEYDNYYKTEINSVSIVASNNDQYGNLVQKTAATSSASGITEAPCIDDTYVITTTIKNSTSGVKQVKTINVSAAPQALTNNKKLSISLSLSDIIPSGCTIGCTMEYGIDATMNYKGLSDNDALNFKQETSADKKNKYDFYRYKSPITKTLTSSSKLLETIQSEGVMTIPSNIIGSIRGGYVFITLDKEKFDTIDTTYIFTVSRSNTTSGCPFRVSTAAAHSLQTTLEYNPSNYKITARVVQIDKSTGQVVPMADRHPFTIRYDIDVWMANTSKYISGCTWGGSYNNGAGRFSEKTFPVGRESKYFNHSQYKTVTLSSGQESQVVGTLGHIPGCGWQSNTCIICIKSVTITGGDTVETISMAPYETTTISTPRSINKSSSSHSWEIAVKQFPGVVKLYNDTVPAPQTISIIVKRRTGCGNSHACYSFYNGNATNEEVKVNSKNVVVQYQLYAIPKSTQAVGYNANNVFTTGVAAGKKSKYYKYKGLQVAYIRDTDKWDQRDTTQTPIPSDEHIWGDQALLSDWDRDSIVPIITGISRTGSGFSSTLVIDEFTYKYDNSSIQSLMAATTIPNTASVSYSWNQDTKQIVTPNGYVNWSGIKINATLPVNGYSVTAYDTRYPTTKQTASVNNGSSYPFNYTGRLLSDSAELTVMNQENRTAVKDACTKAKIETLYNYTVEQEIHCGNCRQPTGNYIVTLTINQRLYGNSTLFNNTTGTPWSDTVFLYITYNTGRTSILQVFTNGVVQGTSNASATTFTNTGTPKIVYKTSTSNISNSGNKISSIQVRSNSNGTLAYENQLAVYNYSKISETIVQKTLNVTVSGSNIAFSWPNGLPTHTQNTFNITLLASNLNIIVPNNSLSVSGSYVNLNSTTKNVSDVYITFNNVPLTGSVTVPLTSTSISVSKALNNISPYNSGYQQFTHNGYNKNLKDLIVSGTFSKNSVSCSVAGINTSTTSISTTTFTKRSSITVQEYSKLFPPCFTMWADSTGNYFNGNTKLCLKNVSLLSWDTYVDKLKVSTNPNAKNPSFCLNSMGAHEYFYSSTDGKTPTTSHMPTVPGSTYYALLSRWSDRSSSFRLRSECKYCKHSNVFDQVGCLYQPDGRDYKTDYTKVYNTAGKTWKA